MCYLCPSPMECRVLEVEARLIEPFWGRTTKYREAVYEYDALECT
jgi:hypothetical protein